MHRVSFKGVIIGGIVDTVASTLGGLALLMFIRLTPAVAALGTDAQAQVIRDLVVQRPAYYLTGFLIGTLCSILGGYVAARIAGHDEILNGALSSFLCVGLGIYELAQPAGEQTPLIHILEFVASPTLGALGGYLRDLQLGREAPAPPREKAPGSIGAGA